MLSSHFILALIFCQYSFATNDLHVCCGCGSDLSSGHSRKEALNTLLEVKQRLRYLKATSQFEIGVPTTVFVSGTCSQTSALIFEQEDGGVSEFTRTIYTSYPGEAPGVITGGIPLLASSLSHVTDAGILAQIPSNARQNVLQVDLAALGITDTGSPACHPYMGGEASILPGNLVKAGMELFMYGDPTINGDLSPLTLARYPNKDKLPEHWSSGSINGYTISTDAETTTHLPLWSQQLVQDPDSVYIHYLGGLEWDDHVNSLAEVTSSTITLSPCPSHYNQPGFDSLDNKGTYYAYNLLSELDSEGEYYINRTSNMLYVWPPSGPSSPYWQISPWGKPVVNPVSSLKTIELNRISQVSSISDTVIGELSLNDDLIILDNTGYLTFDGLIFTTAREAAFISQNSTSIHIVNSIIENLGSMAINASAGSGFSIDSSVVRHAGNGAIFYYAGDRVTLTSAKHTVLNSTVSYSNRYLYCYVPMVALADCGNQILDSELFGGPHQGIFMSGNLHNVSGSILHDLVEAASDSGVIYTGRDWTYQGSVIANNVFHRINTADPGDDVSAVYLDDCVSGYTITGNTFVNISRALLLGGGRDNVFENNTVSFVDGSWAVSFDDRGEGWANGMCKGELTNFLNRVPYNTSSIWMSRFPSLVNILQDGPCQARHNAVNNNNYCYGAQSEKAFIDTDVNTIQSWDSVAVNNTHTC